jgi:YVTN family beta-propeller protein
VFVALGRSNYVAFVDTMTRKIQHYVPVGRSARDAALSASEKTLFVVADGLSDDVSIIDAASRQMITTVPVGHSPTRFAPKASGQPRGANPSQLPVQYVGTTSIILLHANV